MVDATETMQFSVDWWQIKIEDTIDNVDPETSLNECIAGVDALCDTIFRGVGGSLWIGKTGFVESTQLNIGTQKWAGIDVAWAWALGDNWTFDMIGTYSLKREETPLAGAPQTRFDCAGVISPVCYPNPDWRHTATATYDSQSWWALTARWRYYGSVDYDGTTDQIVQDETDAQNYFDLNAIFRFMDTHDVVVGINNIFDKEPPLMGNTISDNGNTQIGFYEALGRYFFADVTLRW